MTIPFSKSFFSIPLNNTPMLSPALPSSNNFLNISTPVTTVLLLSVCIPTISTSSPTLTIPLSTLPVPTVPLPLMLNTSSTDIKNALSVILTGSGIWLSTADINSSMDLQFGQSSLLHPQFIAFNALPLTTGILSPGNSYLLNKSRTSISTKSTNSLSSTASVLFKNTTIAGTPTCLAKSMCSLVCGIGPSTALTTNTAPSICAAPVTIFFI